MNLADAGPWLLAIAGLVTALIAIRKTRAETEGLIVGSAEKALAMVRREWEAALAKIDELEAQIVRQESQIVELRSQVRRERGECSDRLNSMRQEIIALEHQVVRHRGTDQ